MLSIRRGHPDDIHNIKDLLTQIWIDDYVPQLWLDWVQAEGDGIVLVAEDEGRVIGTTYVAFRPGNICWFQALRVHPAYRRQGVGSKLTKASIQQAKAAGKKKVYLGIDEDNTASLGMTAGLGFKQISLYNRFAKSLTQQNSSQDTLWRPATQEDLETIYQAGIAQNISELLLCWQWQPFGREALLQFIKEGHLSVWGKDQVQVWGGLEIYEELQIFAPWGNQVDIKAAIDDAENHGAQRATRVEIWLPDKSPLADYLLTQRGYAPDDGYCLWEYEL